MNNFTSFFIGGIHVISSKPLTSKVQTLKDLHAKTPRTNPMLTQLALKLAFPTKSFNFVKANRPKKHETIDLELAQVIFKYTLLSMTESRNSKVKFLHNLIWGTLMSKEKRKKKRYVPQGLDAFKINFLSSQTSFT